jgi:hydrogenase maturation factor
MPSRKRTGFGIGKIPPGIMLRSVYPKLGKRDHRVILGPGIGRDTAAVRQNGAVWVFTADPITGTSSHIGRLSVEINANDIATTGARPKWYLCTILLPEGAKENSLRLIAGEIHETAKRLGVNVIGGHTEVTAGLDRPIIAGFMVGEARGRFLSPQNSRPGDRILLTKTAGLEGTSILARDKVSLLRKKGVPEDVRRLARGYQEQMSIVEEALLAAGLKGVHAMHDPTEGGVLNGLWEMAEASGVGIEVWADKIPVAPATQLICFSLGLDPLKLMSSGSLLLAVQQSDSLIVRRALSKFRIKLTEVGKLTNRSKGRVLVRQGKIEALRAVPRDELYRVR